MKDLIFDIDGTIWNTTGVAAGAWTEAVAASKIREIEGLIVTAEMLQREFGKPMDVIADDLFGDIDPSAKAKLLEHCCELEHEAIANCKDDLTYEGVRETFRALSKDHNLFIVSNCQNGYIELVMEKNNITDLIKDYECFGHTGLQKDENIKFVIERNKLTDPCYIGDTYGDYVATKKAGIPFVFASYGFGEVEKPDFVIKKFADLLSI